MAKFLVDESCPRAVVDALRAAGHDATYAAETSRRADDRDLVALAQAEDRIIVTEDFDFGELLIRHQLKAPGAIVLFLPRSTPETRAARIMAALGAQNASFENRVTIVSARRVRQRPLLT
jgi:predicted nuclease of predicted toxin-antitoxin system